MSEFTLRKRSKYVRLVQAVIATFIHVADVIEDSGKNVLTMPELEKIVREQFGSNTVLAGYSLTTILEKPASTVLGKRIIRSTVFEMSSDIWYHVVQDNKRLVVYLWDRRGHRA